MMHKSTVSVHSNLLTKKSNDGGHIVRCGRRRIRCVIVSSFVVWVYFTITTYSKINHHHKEISKDGGNIHIVLGGKHDEVSNVTTRRISSPSFQTGKTKTTSTTSTKIITRATSTIRNNNNNNNSNNVDFAENHNTSDCNVHYSYEDIKRCIPPEKRKNMTLLTNCDTITTWNDIQRCVNGRGNRIVESSGKSNDILSKKNMLLKNVDFLNNNDNYLDKMRINLIGERNSGTKWIVDEMQNCFPKDKYGFKIERDLYGRNKHFFQLTGRNVLQRRHVVIAVFRDPVEWVAAMIEKPYHMPYHMNGFDRQGKPIPIHWKEFVNKTWSMPNRSKADFKLLDEMKLRPHKYFPCRSGLNFHEVMPCRFDPKTIPDHLVRAHNPVYELKRGSGKTDEVYKTILELRSDKIVNFLLEVPILQDLGGYLAVKFEDLLQNGTRTLLEKVADMLGIEGGLPETCRPQGPKPEVIGRRKIPLGLRQWVEDHLVLRTERLLGYR